MTTAHRPTWKPAYGLSDNVSKGIIPTRNYSSRDLPGYLKLKNRQQGQGSVDELKNVDFKAELIKKQKQLHLNKIGKIETIQANNVDYIQVYEPLKKRIKRPQENQTQFHSQDNPFPEDEDSEEFIRENQEEQMHLPRIQSDSQEESQDSQELLRQYEKIKEQREKEDMHKREQKHRQSIANREAQLLKGNPLIDSSFSLSKKWYEDTIFRNQAKKVTEKKSYINDYVRSDFHRKFMNRFVMR